MDVELLAERVRAEFDEAPGLMLTLPQASKFFGLDQQVTRSVVERLIGASHLRWTRGGALVRAGQ